MLLACGAIEAITWAAGESAAASCAMWQASSQALWEAVSAIALSASSEASLQAVTASVQEADTWGQETGTFCLASLSCYKQSFLLSRYGFLWNDAFLLCKS